MIVPRPVVFTAVAALLLLVLVVAFELGMNHGQSSSAGKQLVSANGYVVQFPATTRTPSPSVGELKQARETGASKSNVRSAIPAAESFYQNNTTAPSTYTGVTGDILRTQAPGVSPNVKAVSLNSGAGYCVEDTEGRSTFDYIGGSPGAVTGTLATIEAGTCHAEAGTAAT